MKFDCDGCGTTTAHDPARGHVPPGWVFRKIGGRVCTLCSACGNEAHFAGGISPALRDALRQRLNLEIGEEG